MVEENSATIKNKCLKLIRVESKLTQDDMAKALGITRSAYQHLEAKGNLTAEILYKLSRIFSRPIEDFIDDAEEDYAPSMLRDGTSLFKRKEQTLLSDEEKELLDTFATLSPQNRARVIGYVKGISLIEKETN